MIRIVVAACLAAGVLATTSVTGHEYKKGDLRVGHPWTRATPPGAKVAAGYLTMRNSGKLPERILGASSPAAERVELHIQVRDGDVLKMREVSHFEIPPGGRLTLRPGGSHLMLVGLKKPFAKGEHIPLTVRFERAGEVQVEVEVQSGEAAHSHH